MMREVDKDKYIFFTSHGDDHAIPKDKIRNLLDEPRKTEGIDNPSICLRVKTRGAGDTLETPFKFQEIEIDKLGLHKIGKFAVWVVKE